ncbi:MAG: S1 RNA-binding domain-containing protein, partial [Chthonomonadaceae bacterium]|nr:S1 RNA-binding domain-containing protein [Chthonomonadaceae bacterium]
HISQICEERIQSVTDKLAVGDSVRVKVMEIDKQGRVRLTMRQVDA